MRPGRTRPARPRRRPKWIHLWMTEAGTWFYEPGSCLSRRAAARRPFVVLRSAPREPLDAGERVVFHHEHRHVGCTNDRDGGADLCALAIDLQVDRVVRAVT